MRTFPVRTLRSILLLEFALASWFGFASAAERPNVLLIISDDQSYPHASAYGCEFINTPGFDRIAESGVLFENAFAASPGCSPCRAALLTGRHTWMIEHAGTHASSFPKKFRTYPEMLAGQGYHVGYTGKGWGPGNYKIDGRENNPAGPAYNKQRSDPGIKGISRVDYAANFSDFLKSVPDGVPFCFWCGGQEPHRPYQAGVGKENGKSPDSVSVPEFLPDVPEIRSDLLDYAFEIEYFDSHVVQILDQLEAAGELENTLIIATADNGMPFPRAKANCYEYGIHMPLAIRWGKKGSRRCSDIVGFVDLTATIYDIAGVKPDPNTPLVGRSLKHLLESDRSGSIEPDRKVAFSARERHSSSRYQNLGYPQRAIRTPEYLYIWNCRPERWPAGTPRKLDENGELGPEHGGYHDIDACPTLTWLIGHVDDPQYGKYLAWSVAKRPEYELYDIQNDAACLKNLAGSREHADAESALRKQLDDELRRTGDPRILDGGDIFETYKRYSHIRSFPPPEE